MLCRAAADAGVPARALRAAVVHTRACRECHRFAHRLGTACAWLDERSRQASPLGGGRSGVSSAPSGGASFIGVLRRALARQLGARLARDLADWARGGGGRLPAIRRRDVRRLTALLPSAERRRPPWGRALLLARRERPPDRPPVLELLGLATALDPEGVDLSLEYVRQLVRHEEHARAEAEADRAVAYLA